MRDPNGVFRGALIGCGYFGQIQLEAWRRMPDVEIVAACDVDLAKAQASAARAYTSVEELLEWRRGIDFIDIATRPDTHLSLVRAAVEGSSDLSEAGVAYFGSKRYRWRESFRQLERACHDSRKLALAALVSGSEIAPSIAAKSSTADHV